MKNLIVLIGIFFSVTIKAQDIASYGKATSNEVKLYHPKNGQQTDLEKTGAVKKQKKKLGGFAGMSFTYEMEGEKSPMRINADSAIFVIEQGTGMFSMDISMAILLYKLEIKDGKRVAVQGNYKPSLFGVGKTTDTKITTSSKQLKEGLKQIIPEKKLQKGEYAFLGGMVGADGDATKCTVYAFGID
jgi:hypothetical protein